MRFPALLALIAALAVALFVGYFTTGSTVVENHGAYVASSTGLAVLPTVTLPELGIPEVNPTAPANPAATSSASSGAAPSKKPAVVATAPKAQPVVAPAPTPAPPPAPSGNLASASTEVRAALVNIICSVRSGSSLQSISGSGVMIDPRGILLTNAHIGQYFLLADRGVRCTIRTGSPATDAYYAAPIFISPAWLNANPTAITQQNPTGTGEHDFALLAVTRSATSAPLPQSFPYAPLAQDAPSTGESVVIGSYAAQFLATTQILTSLYPTIVYGSVKDVYTFDTNTVDIVSLGGSAAAQEGSSGGGAVDAEGNLIATITTSTTQGDTSTRQLNALTAPYIRRDYAAQTGLALSTLLAMKPSDMIANFAPQIPALESVLTSHF